MHVEASEALSGVLLWGCCSTAPVIETQHLKRLNPLHGGVSLYSCSTAGLACDAPHCNVTLHIPSL